MRIHQFHATTSITSQPSIRAHANRINLAAFQHYTLVMLTRRCTESWRRSHRAAAQRTRWWSPCWCWWLTAQSRRRSCMQGRAEGAQSWTAAARSSDCATASEWSAWGRCSMLASTGRTSATHWHAGDHSANLSSATMYQHNISTQHVSITYKQNISTQHINTTYKHNIQAQHINKTYPPNISTQQNNQKNIKP